jgi:hypothetical protein
MSKVMQFCYHIVAFLFSASFLLLNSFEYIIDCPVFSPESRQKNIYRFLWSHNRENHHVQMPQVQSGQAVLSLAAPYKGRAEQIELC